jgi:3-carboxy-cis,cis-muconate cycloisomerase
MAQEHERSAGAWQAEWGSLSQLFELTAGVFARTRALLEGLEVDEGRMERNLRAAGGATMAEAVLAALSLRMPGGEARLVMDRVAARSRETGAPLRECVMAEAAATSRLTEVEIDQALDPRNYLGAAGAFVDRALEAYRSQVAPAQPGRGAG